jgi:hypothetical protein
VSLIDPPESLAGKIAFPRLLCERVCDDREDSEPLITTPICVIVNRSDTEISSLSTMTFPKTRTCSTRSARTAKLDRVRWMGASAQ